MSTILPRPTFLRLPPDPKGRTRPETLLSLTSIEQVRWIPAAEGRPAELQLAAINGASARADQTVKGTDAEVLWAQLQALHETEWRAITLAAEAPGIGARLGQALGVLNGAATAEPEGHAAAAAAQGVAALFNRRYTVGQGVQHWTDPARQEPPCERRTRSEAWVSEDNAPVVLPAGVVEPVPLAQVKPVAGRP